MAPPSTTNKFLIYLGDGATPTEAFAWPCGANARSVTLTTNTGELEVLDCTDPLEAPSVLLRWSTSQDTSLQISGVVARESWDKWREWADSGLPRNIRVLMDIPAASGGGYWTLPALLTSLELSGEGKGKIAFTAQIAGAGQRVWTDAS